jgi:hypothetical protein
VLYDAVTYIVKRLNESLNNQTGSDEELVVISSLSDDSDASISDRMVATLVNIERDVFSVKSNQITNVTENQLGKLYRPVNLNFYLLFVANFHGEKYPQGLKFIDMVIDFFQHNPVFDRTHDKSIPPGIEKLLMEIESVSLRELQSIWTLMTGQYMPSVLYKVRTISMLQALQGTISGLGGLDAGVQHSDDDDADGDSDHG